MARAVGRLLEAPVEGGLVGLIGEEQPQQRFELELGVTCRCREPGSQRLRFMTTARAIYRAFGFVEVARFDDGSETTNTVLDPLTIAMELDLAAFVGT